MDEVGGCNKSPSVALHSLIFQLPNTYFRRHIRSLDEISRGPTDAWSNSNITSILAKRKHVLAMNYSPNSAVWFRIFPSTYIS